MVKMLIISVVKEHTFIYKKVGKIVHHFAYEQWVWVNGDFAEQRKSSMNAATIYIDSDIKICSGRPSRQPEFFMIYVTYQ